MRTFLHVGSGPQRKDKTTAGFNTSDWQEMRLDIDASVSPDVIGTMTDMSAIDTASVDAIYSSHNEFNRVLKPDGFVVITCPDLKSVCALVADDKLTEPAYTSPAGPIAPLDILYGYRPSMALGNLYMSHRCGFTEKVLVATLQSAGFGSVASLTRPRAFDIWAVATKASGSEDLMRALAQEHFPR